MFISFRSLTPLFSVCVLFSSAFARADGPKPIERSACVKGLTSKDVPLSNLEVTGIIGAGVPLSQTESLVLIEKWRIAKTSREKQTIQSRLFNGHVRLLAKISKSWFLRNRHLNFADIFQEGAASFSRAIEKYDPQKGNKFSNYVWNWFKAGISIYIVTEVQRYGDGLRFDILRNYFMAAGEVHRRLDSLGRPHTPENLSKAFNQRTVDRFKLRHGRLPTESELDELGKSYRLIHPDEAHLAEFAIYEFRNPKSLTRDDGKQIDVRDDQTSIDEVLVRTETQTQLQKIFTAFRNTLATERERLIFDQRILVDTEDRVSTPEFNAQHSLSVTRQATEKLEQRIRRDLKKFSIEQGALDLL